MKDNKHKKPPLGAKKCSDICAYTLIICSWNLTVFRERILRFLGTDNVHGQISEHILAPNGGYCLYIIIVRQNNKELLDEVFVIPGIIKVEVSVISLSLRLRLITLIETLITLDITKPNLIIFLLYIVLKNITTNALLHRTQFIFGKLCSYYAVRKLDITLGNYALRAQLIDYSLIW